MRGFFKDGDVMVLDEGSDKMYFVEVVSKGNTSSIIKMVGSLATWEVDNSRLCVKTKINVPGRR